MQKDKFDWDAYDRHVKALRDLGCAVIAIEPYAIQTLTADEDDEPTISDADALAWAKDNAEYIEDAIMGDYWGDTMRDLLEQHPLERTQCSHKA